MAQILPNPGSSITPSKTTSPVADSQKEVWQVQGTSQSAALLLPGRGLGLSPVGALGRKRPGL